MSAAQFIANHRTGVAAITGEETRQKRAELDNPDWTNPTTDLNVWVDIAVREWLSIAGKDFNKAGLGTKLKLAGIFQKVGAITDSGAVAVGTAIRRFPGDHKWWTKEVGYEWPTDTFCEKLAGALLPDAEPESAQPDSPPVLGPAETDWL